MVIVRDVFLGDLHACMGIEEWGLSLMIFKYEWYPDSHAEIKGQEHTLQVVLKKKGLPLMV